MARTGTQLHRDHDVVITFSENFHVGCRGARIKLHVTFYLLCLHGRPRLPVNLYYRLFSVLTRSEAVESIQH